MNKIIYGILIAFSISLFSSFAYADENCEMPPGIDDDEIYWIHFKNESKMYRYKILELKTAGYKSGKKLATTIGIV